MECDPAPIPAVLPPPPCDRWFRRLAGATILLLAGCSGELTHRSLRSVTGELPIDASVQRIRVEVFSGTVDIKAGAGRSVRYGADVRRASDSAEQLAKIEAIELQLGAVLDAAEPGTMIVRVPGIDRATVEGVLAWEIGMHLPPGIPLEVVIAGSGNITLEGRTAATKVTTARGDLRFNGCAGSLQAHTGRGNAIVLDHEGDVDIDSGVGDMQVFVKKPASLIRLVSGHGTLQCHLPGTTELEVDALASVGKIGNGFGFVVERLGDYSAALRGKLGAGTTRVVLRTGSGALSLSPKKFD